MKKYIKIISLVLIALIFIGTFVFLYQKSQPKDTAYDILHTKTTDLAQITVATGKIEPRDEVQIKPQISGIISEVYKEAGETVKKGEIIAKVKVIPELGSLNSAESRVRLADAGHITSQKRKCNHNQSKDLVFVQFLHFFLCFLLSFIESDYSIMRFFSRNKNFRFLFHSAIHDAQFSVLFHAFFTNRLLLFLFGLTFFDILSASGGYYYGYISSYHLTFRQPRDPLPAALQPVFSSLQASVSGCRTLASFRTLQFYFL